MLFRSRGRRSFSAPTTRCCPATLPSGARTRLQRWCKQRRQLDLPLVRRPQQSPHIASAVLFHRRQLPPTLHRVKVRGPLTSSSTACTRSSASPSLLRRTSKVGPLRSSSLRRGVLMDLTQASLKLTTRTPRPFSIYRHPPPSSLPSPSPLSSSLPRSPKVSRPAGRTSSAKSRTARA